MLPALLAMVVLAQDPFEERRLSVIPEDCIYEGHATFARNGSAVAYIVNRGGKKQDPESSVIHGGRYHVIVNQKEGEGFFQIAGTWGLESLRGRMSEGVVRRLMPISSEPNVPPEIRAAFESYFCPRGWSR